MKDLKNVIRQLENQINALQNEREIEIAKLMAPYDLKIKPLVKQLGFLKDKIRERAPRVITSKSKSTANSRLLRDREFFLSLTNEYIGRRIKDVDSKSMLMAKDFFEKNASLEEIAEKRSCEKSRVVYWIEYVLEILKKEPNERERNLKIEKGEVVALMGRSGCGKSTLIKVISSYIKPTNGEVVVDANLAYVSQSSHKTLFPWLNVENNVRYPNKLRKTLNDESVEYCDKLLDVFKIGHLRKYYPTKLSQGEQKRLSLAVALSYKPEIILLDEPFTGIDFKLSTELWNLLYNDFKNRQASALFITHSVHEASIADRVVLLDKTLTSVEKTGRDFKTNEDYATYIIEQL